MHDEVHAQLDAAVSVPDVFIRKRLPQTRQPTASERVTNEYQP